MLRGPEIRSNRQVTRLGNATFLRRSPVTLEGLAERIHRKVGDAVSEEVLAVGPQVRAHP